MKIFVFLSYLLCLVGFSKTYSQTITPIDTTKQTPNLVASYSVTSFLPSVTPKSPNAAALERYGIVPVSLFTGLPSIEIPIYDIKVGNLVVPIKLTYHASGNKVNDNPSWVGLGWNLQAGGAISRTIRGRADEDTGNGGVLGQNLFNLSNYQTNIPCLTEQLKTDLELFTDYNKDIERDIFTVSIPTKNNSFALLPTTGAFWLESDASKISYTSGLQSLTLLDETGVQYKFAEKENTGSYPTTWYVSEIQGTQPTDKIVFTYQANSTTPITINQSADYEIYHTDIGGSNQNAISRGTISKTTADQSFNIDVRLLNEIYFPNGKIVFVTNPIARADNLGKSLSAVEIYSFNPSNNGYTLVKKLSLVQTYMDERLFLESANWYGNDNEKIGVYSFNYNTTPLPKSKLSRSIDYWGYYNGQDNLTLIPTQSFQANELSSGPLVTYNVGGANRNSNELNMQARVLTQINYPTGGYTTFEYEAHRYNSGQLAGGLRVKKIISNDLNGKTLTRTYKYGVNESGNGTYRTVTPFTYSTIQTQKSKKNPFNPGSSEYNYKVRVFSSAFIIPQHASDGSAVTYETVTEYEDGGSGANGKTVYVFEEGNGDDWVSQPASGKSFFRSRAWSRGQLKNKTVYGSTGTKKYELKNTNSIIQSGISPDLGYLVAKTEVQLGYYITDGNGCLQDYSTFIPIRNTYFSYGLRKLTSSEEYYYDDTDASQYVYHKTETDYSTSYFQPKEIRLLGSDGDIRIERFRYATDFSDFTNYIVN